MTTFFSIEIPIHARYLHLPVREGCQRVTVRLMRGEQLAREFAIELALSEPVDWWAFYDLSAFAGQTLRLELSPYGQSAGESAEVVPPQTWPWLEQSVRLSDELMGMEGLYHELYRPQFHFTSRRGWNNDPNGLVYHAGEWHMFYQHNPFGTHWGNMHWGHAVSRDLVHWQELDEALYQHSLEDMAFSGGGLVDQANTAGFQQGPEAPLVVAFTSTGRGECLAYSNDHGRTLTEWTGNPFLAHRGRDPKIIWYAPENKWILIVYEELEGERGEERVYALYDSPDLKQWRRLSHLSGWFECPELFSLPLDSDPQERLWVIYGCRWEGSRSACLIGDFDGRQFITKEENLIAHCGPAFYAAQIFNNAPGERVIMVGWLFESQYPGMPFSQGMTVPLELSVRSTLQGTRLCFYPVRELEVLRERSAAGAGLSYTAANDLLANGGELLDVELVLRAEGPLALDVRGHPLTYDPASGKIAFAGNQANLPTGAGSLKLRVLVDRSVTEVFANDGLAAFAAMTIFEDTTLPLRLEGQGEVEKIAVHTLHSIWPA